MVTALASLVALAPGAADVAVQLDPLYYERCRRPCEYVGFSFAEDPTAMREMREHGANAVGTGSMWVPTDDPTAPDGCGVPDLGYLGDMLQLGQSFTAGAPITGAALCAPTFNTRGSGCTLSLYATPPDQWGASPAPLATQTFAEVADNQRVWLTFEALPAGSYYLEQTQPTGDGIGLWAVGRDAYAAGQAYVARAPISADDFELWIRTAEGEAVVVAPEDDHHALRLGAGAANEIARHGLYFDYAVGNWNNGGFPYYPKWFIERFPEHAMLDQDGRPIMCGMFGELAPWPNLDNAVIAEGTERYIRSVVGALKDNPNLLYWCMGGEALYATYLMPHRWTDYSEDALAHYRAWQRLQGEPGTDAPPRQPARDLATAKWLRFRNTAMGERSRAHFAATKAADPFRLALSCNHGDVFAGMAGTWLGQDLAQFAGASDGWEMGQIMADGDPDLFNLLWMRAAGTFSKPLCPVRLAYKKSDPRARGGGTSYTPEAARRYFWESVGTGAWHMGFIQWSGSLPDGEWGVKGTPAQQEIGAIVSEWHAMEPHFDDAWPVREPVGLYCSQLTWTLDGFQPLWTRLHRELTQRQIGYRILLDEQLRARDLRGITVIITADNPVMSRDCVEALGRFAEEGGKLIEIGRNALEDELLQPQTLAAPGQTLRADSPLLMEELEREIGEARLVTVAAAADRPYIAPITEATIRHHDTPYDLAGQASIGQSFTTTQAGLRSVSVSNPTYTRTVAGHRLTLELRESGPRGRVLATRTYEPEDLTDNAWHAVQLAEPAPPGTYYLRLATPEGLPPQTLGAWGTQEDAYLGGALHLNDQPSAGDLRLELAFDAERPAEAALEVFPLSDGTNAIVIVTNITDLPIEAEVAVAASILPEASYEVRDLATGAALGKVPSEEARVRAAVPAHRSAVLYFAATEPGDVAARLAEAEAALAPLPPGATGPNRAHLQRAREGLAGGRPAKALASLRKAQERAPMIVAAQIDGEGLVIRAETFGGAQDGTLAARFVPCPGVALPLEHQTGGVYAGSVPLVRLPWRYDYRRREYRPYWGGLEVQVTGEVDGRAAAGACVVEVPKG
jgi:hypothetical protein